MILLWEDNFSNSLPALAKIRIAIGKEYYLETKRNANFSNIIIRLKETETWNSQVNSTSSVTELQYEV